MKRSFEMIFSISFIGMCIIFIIAYLEYINMRDTNNEIEENITYIKAIDSKSKDKITSLNEELEKVTKEESNTIEENEIWEDIEKSLNEALSS